MRGVRRHGVSSPSFPVPLSPPHPWVQREGAFSRATLFFVGVAEERGMVE